MKEIDIHSRNGKESIERGAIKAQPRSEEW